MRLDKYVSKAGGISRSDAKKEIKKGQVSVDQQIIRDPAFNIEEKNTNLPAVLLKGAPLGYVEHLYFMLHKPAGYLTATEDQNRATVLDLISPEDTPRKKELFPVGRLDKDTEGLLLLTNNGELSHHLLSPRHHVDKTYFALVDMNITDAHIKAFRDGLKVDEELTAQPAELRLASEEERVAHTPTGAGTPTAILITIQEGKFHQIKRMVKAIGGNVLYLKRISMGPLTLDPTLSVGDYRPLTEEEIKLLLNA